MEQFIDKIQAWITSFGFRIVGAIVILVVGYIAAKIIRSIIMKLLQRSKVDDTLRAFLTNIAYAAMLTFVIIAAMAKAGIQTASLVAVIAAAGLAIGFALQGSLSNFAAGVMLILFKPFKINDFIDAGGVMGVVEDINIFTTELRSTDNKKIVVPNSQITGGSITNFTAKDTRRMDLVAGVSYQDDIDKVRKTLEAILAEDERILKDPAPRIGILEFADSSVNFAVRPWVKTTEYWDVFFDLNEKIKKRFDEEGICIPFPQRDIHMYTEQSQS